MKNQERQLGRTGPKPKPIMQRLMRHSVPEPNSGCLIWLGYVMANGYGNMKIGSAPEGTYRTQLTHRVAYEAFVGEVPPGMFVLHKCDVRCCINPDHLFLGTHADNMQDMINKGRHNPRPRLTHCKRGHSFTQENTYTDKNGRRGCKQCRKIHDAAWKQRNRTKGS